MRGRITLLPRVLALMVAVMGQSAARASRSRRKADPPAIGPELMPDRREAGRDFYRIAFRGGEPAEVSVAGDGTTNLDLFVYGTDGQAVCSSERADDKETCRWLPPETAEFTVEVRNLGNQGNSYILWTN